jgi:hypothetical protein
MGLNKVRAYPLKYDLAPTKNYNSPAKNLANLRCIPGKALAKP